MQKQKIFEEVDPRQSLPALERELVELWAREDTFGRSLAHREGAPRFVFYEGPPTANGRPGVHHVLARAYKDLFGRHRTMKGFYVERKAGWDTHGLPVELEVERKLGISGKQQIEEFGVERFNELCRQSVYEYVDVWRDMSERMGFWQDYEHAYWTLTPDYIQSEWWALKQLWDRDLITKGFRVAPYCPRCQTPLSSHELALGYEDDVEDPSIVVRFPLKNDPTTSILAWTTTPWTLPGNVGLAVAEDVDYVKAQQGSEYLILAEARLDVLDGDYEVVERLKGRDLVGLDYTPPYEIPAPQRAHYVIPADFVSTEDGTGVVHTSASYGADDLRIAQEMGLPVRHTVDLQGRFTPEVEKFAGLFVKDADPKIIEDLQARGLLYRSETIRHTYPFCWRCGTPLLYYALDAWYIRTTAFRDQLVANNLATHWEPAHIQTGRMGDWLENNVDWQFSRSRYWGTPLPIWVCEACGEQRCVGGVEELGLAPEADLHRPGIDEVTLACACGGTMRRVPEVLDAWFDSGAMPFAQRGYPREHRELFEETFPADFICEAVDQTRGWFYSLLAISTMLFGQNSYRNVICLGHILDEQGRKMSKSLGNVLEPDELFDAYGADALRWLFFVSPVGESFRAGPTLLQEVVRQFLLTVRNVHSFFVGYANLDGFVPGERPQVPVEERPLLDRWLLSRLTDVTQTVDGALDRYDVNQAARPLQAFVEDLSNWYVRRSRRRFWKSADDSDKLAAYQTLYETLVTLSRLLAPFTPFLADALHRNLCRRQSVHLADYPVADPTRLDPDLEREMADARQAVGEGLAARDAARVRVRQPLRSVTLTRPFRPEIRAIVQDELNVKEVHTGPEFALDTELDEELRQEGMARDAVRWIQELRKRSGLRIEDRIVLLVEAEGPWTDVFDRHREYVAGETLAVDVRFERPADVEGVSREGLWLGLRKAG
ncbi:MAG TPA: isoleucine--tRNA ligase [Candidatus Binatia bacterium]|nr:isoleucine--tRNA ligase [Candidatus Binatia bacterium]